MKQKKRCLMMVMEIFKNHNLVTIATTKKDNMSTHSCNNLFLVQHLLYINTHNLWTCQTFVTCPIQSAKFCTKCDFEHTWRRLFQKLGMCTNSDIYLIILKQITIMRYLFYPLYSQLKWEILLFYAVYTFVLHFFKICEISINWIMCPWRAIIVIVNCEFIVYKMVASKTNEHNKSQIQRHLSVHISTITTSVV